MKTNLTIKNYNEKENTEMKRLNLYESRLFGRVCYGFGRDEDGYVYVKEEFEIKYLKYTKQEIALILSTKKEI